MQQLQRLRGVAVGLLNARGSTVRIRPVQRSRVRTGSPPSFWLQIVPILRNERPTYFAYSSRQAQPGTMSMVLASRPMFDACATRTKALPYRYLPIYAPGSFPVKLLKVAVERTSKTFLDWRCTSTVASSQHHQSFNPRLHRGNSVFCWLVLFYSVCILCPRNGTWSQMKEPCKRLPRILAWAARSALFICLPFGALGPVASAQHASSVQNRQSSRTSPTVQLR